MKMKKYLVMVMIVASLLLGCGSTLKEGEIYKKTFTPEHDETVYIPYTYCIGKNTTTILMPQTIHHSDSWEIKIRNYNEAKQRYDTATYYVDKETFDHYNIGDLFQYENYQFETEDEKRRENGK